MHEIDSFDVQKAIEISNIPEDFEVASPHYIHLHNSLNEIIGVP
jgi:hypothetical protein